MTLDPTATAATGHPPVAADGVPGSAPEAPPPWVTVSRAGDPLADPPVETRRIVVGLVAGLVAVLAVVAMLGTLAAQRLAEREAVNDAADVADVLAGAVIQPSLRDALLTGDAAAVAGLDEVVRGRVLGPGVVRVKVWSVDGTVLYADEPQLVGRRFALSAEQRAVLAEPATRAEVSDLEESENEFEAADRLVEVYRPVWTPSGSEVLFEMYAPYQPVSDRAGQLWRGFAGVMLSSLLLLLVLMAPVVWRMLRQLRASQRHRERLLRHAVDASDDERRRIAGSLHDGPVQELVATSYAVSGAAGRADAAGDVGLAGELTELATTVRGSVRALRSLLVEIYPPSLEAAGLAATLADLAQGLHMRGVTVDLAVDPRAVDLPPDQGRLVHRVAQECLRNVAEHAAPGHATVSLTQDAEGVVLDIVDDGPGFDPALLTDPHADHFGLRVLADVASAGGAVLRLATGPGRGTHWQLRLAQDGVTERSPGVRQSARDHPDDLVWDDPP